MVKESAEGQVDEKRVWQEHAAKTLHQVDQHKFGLYWIIIGYQSRINNKVPPCHTAATTGPYFW